MNPIERTFKKQRNIGVGEPLKCLASEPRARGQLAAELGKDRIEKGVEARGQCHRQWAKCSQRRIKYGNRK